MTRACWHCGPVTRRTAPILSSSVFDVGHLLRGQDGHPNVVFMTVGDADTPLHPQFVRSVKFLSVATPPVRVEAPAYGLSSLNIGMSPLKFVYLFR